jgi:hypothetical protein
MGCVILDHLLHARSDARYDVLERLPVLDPTATGNFRVFSRTAARGGLVGREGEPFIEFLPGTIPVRCVAVRVL